MNFIITDKLKEYMLSCGFKNILVTAMMCHV